MMRSLFAAALVSATMLSAPASAVTLTIGDGQLGCESSNEFSNFAGVPCDVGGTPDLSNDPNSPSTVSFLGTGFLLGFVLDNEGLNDGQYPDYANVTLAEKSLVTFVLFPENGTFDAQFDFGILASEVVDFSNPIVQFTADAGTYFFGLNATSPNNNQTAVSTEYALVVEAISPVPLPAGAVLLLTGLGGLAIARRKKAA